jgi:ChrB-like protein
VADRTRWVLLAYRLPREPSTPRIALWRKLKRLGVAQLLDGLVGLPLNARNREHLEWLADQVSEAGGEATIWLADPAAHVQERELRESMQAAVAAQYRDVAAQADAAATQSAGRRRRTLSRLRRELERIRRRDYFPPPERDTAHTAVESLSERVERHAA